MSEIAILTIGSVIIVPLQVELHDQAARNLQRNILNKIERINAKGLLMDVSGVNIIDSFLGRLLVETAKMAGLMGAETVLVGMKKEVVLTLIHLGMIMKDVRTAMNLEDGLTLLNRLTGNAYEKQQR
jgi:rsbT antagonist protein RsbS